MLSSYCNSVCNFNEPVLTDLSGRDDRELYFSMKAEIYGACPLTWRNEHYIFGGYTRQRNVGKVNGCELEVVGELDFDFKFGGCANFRDEKLFLCFHSDQIGKTDASIWI